MNMGFCKGTEFVTMNGHLNNDKYLGNYTYYHPNGGKSLPNYLIAMSSFMDSIDNFTAFPSKRADTDHVPVSFSIQKWDHSWGIWEG